MPFVFELLLSGAIIGLVIAVLERSAFPGWPQAIGCALGIGLATAVCGSVLPAGLWFLAYAGGAGAGAFLIVWLCETSLRKGMIASGVYLAIRLVLGVIWSLIS